MAIRIIVPVLGVPYTIKSGNSIDFPFLTEMDGCCDTTTKEIIISDMTEAAKSPDAKGDLFDYQRKVLRHELIHAFLYECGLSCGSRWAENEEMVDWLAIQFPKLNKLFNFIEILKEKEGD